MNNPKITILMPAYNAEVYIKEAIGSVLQQNFSDFELLIIDDGSTDLTEQIIRSFSDHRIRLIKQVHSGIVSALNRGLQESKSAYIARFDADDICLPERLEKQFTFLQANAKHVICGGEAEYISSDGEHLFNFKCVAYNHESLISTMQTQCPFIHSSVMYRKEEVLKAGAYSDGAHGFEDHLLWTKLSGHGYFANLADQLIKVRFNSASVTIDEKWRGKEFRGLKGKILRQGFVSQKQANRLKEILDSQNTSSVKESSYYALCAKKFLVNNYLPKKARLNLGKAIRLQPLRLDNYALLFISFFPKTFIQWLYKKTRY